MQYNAIQYPIQLPSPQTNLKIKVHTKPSCSLFCQVLKMEIIFLDIIDQVIFPKKLTILYIFNKKKVQNWREEKGHFSFLNCPNCVTIFCQVLKMEIIFFDIPSNPPPNAVRNSLTNIFFQKNWWFCIFSTTKKCQVYIGISILVIPDHMWAV